MKSDMAAERKRFYRTGLIIAKSVIEANRKFSEFQKREMSSKIDVEEHREVVISRGM